MPPVNPRTTKLKNIIKKINTQSAQQLTNATIIQSRSITPTEEHVTNRVAADKLEYTAAAGQSSVKSPILETRGRVRNRKSSYDSSCSNQSDRDFSPASDNDPEYKPEPKEKAVSSSSSSSRSSSSSGSLSSSGSSSSSSKTDSENLSNSATPSKQKCIYLKEPTTDSINQPNRSVCALAQIAFEYNYDSSSDSDNIVDKNSPLTKDKLSNENISVEGQKLPVNEELSPSIVHEQFDLENLSHVVSFYNPESLKCLALKLLNTATPKSPENNSNVPTRKRKRGSKKDLAKSLRNMGLQYTSSSSQQKIVSERKMGPPCNSNCRLKCSNTISEESRSLAFKHYWDMGSLAKQRDFISKHISEINPKYQYKKLFNNRKNKHAFYLTINNKKNKVCKTFFKNTLGINDRPIRTVIEKMNSSGIVEPERRGKHENHGTKISNDLLAEVKKHIESIPRIESHYLRKQTTREFIEGGKTLTDLYRDYRKDCQNNGRDFVKINIYRKVFKEDYNISFFTPKKDQCCDCVAFENASPVDKEKMEEKYRLHLKEKDLSREEKLRDKEMIDDNNIVACYDLQAMLQVPKGDVSSFYYKSRLNCLNFTICELKADLTKCYFWTEVEGQKGANEIGSCVFKYLEEKSVSSSGKLNITFYSDNCCGQQKNQFVFSMYIYAVKNLPNIESITHKFLIKGHTQNEGDSVHSTIERQIKKRLRSGPIYVPDQYINAIRDAKKKGNKYHVVEMSHSEFYDIKNMQEFKLTKNTQGETVKMGEIKILKIEKSDSGVGVFYKTSYAEDIFKEIQLQKLRRQPRTQLIPLYNGRLPLAANKKKDLEDLIKKNAILPYYVSSYYNHIL
ncbi:hypothetical protein ABMA28_015581 [Loxostege sticticalis]|uniref:DUF7869 domain-containing protein n=1 Tax=Loxostege sticticalis TaxID=481309 RepID=A0ABD0TAA5_LOXSC